MNTRPADDDARASAGLATADLVNAEILACDASALSAADAGTLDALARLVLGARRRGARVLLIGANPDLLELLDLAGLANLLVLDADAPDPSDRAGREVLGQPELREQSRVEEVRDAADPTG